MTSEEIVKKQEAALARLEELEMSDILQLKARARVRARARATQAKVRVRVRC